MERVRKLYTKDTYNGFVIMDKARRERGKVTNFYKSMLDGLFRLAYFTRDSSGYSRPVGLMFSFAFTDESLNYPINKVMTKIWNAYSKSRLPRYEGIVKVRQGRKPESTFKPEYMWCREVKYLDLESGEFYESLTKFEQERYRLADLDGCPIPYEHYHVVIVVDDKFGSWLSIKTVLDRLVDAGVIRAGFHFSQNNVTKNKVLDLKDEEDFQEFIYRSAYICKTDTKNFADKRFWAMSTCRRRRSKPSRSGKKIKRNK